MTVNQSDNFFSVLELNIRQHAKQQKITLSDLAAAIDMTEAGFYKMLSTESIKVKTLKKIAQVLKQPIPVFFEEFKTPATVGYYSAGDEQMHAAEPAAGYINERESLKKQISLLESQIADKNKIIELLSR